MQTSTGACSTSRPCTLNRLRLRNLMSVDVGATLLHKPQLIEVSGGIWYWINEYGKPTSDPGAKQMTPIFGIVLHLARNRVHHGQ